MKVSHSITSPNFKPRYSTTSLGILARTDLETAFARVTLEVFANSFSCIYYLSIYLIIKLPILPNVYIEIVTYVTLEMSKGYVKENGKYKLVDKQEPILIGSNRQHLGPLSLEVLDARLKRLESIIIGAQK
jgi:hypothetical protein